MSTSTYPTGLILELCFQVLITHISCPSDFPYLRFTYLADANRSRARMVVSEIKSSFKWFLSGTPPHGSFDDIKSLADILGVHLGIDETLPGMKVRTTQGRQTAKETTNLEDMSHFLDKRSGSWHERRHRLAQRFLDRFVRQNKAEIDEIPWESHSLRVHLPSAELAIYFELKTHLDSLDISKAVVRRDRKDGTTKKSEAKSDREQRRETALQSSDSPDEALLKCCSHFAMSSLLDSNPTSAMEAINEVIKLRRRELGKVIHKMTDALVDAYRQRQTILASQPDWSSIDRAGAGEVLDALEPYLQLVKREDSVLNGADKDVHEEICRIQRRASELAAGKAVKAIKRNMCDLRVLKVKLRDHMSDVRTDGKELCGRIRSLRYMRAVGEFQKRSTSWSCDACGLETIPHGQVGILTCCGHVGCVTCLESRAGRSICVESLCQAKVNMSHFVKGSHLGLGREVEKSGRFGRKLTLLAARVKLITEKQNERVIVFCQFDDLQKTVLEALKEVRVIATVMKGSVREMTKIVDVFQRKVPEDGDSRVLLLKMDDEQSSGLNLT